MIRLGLTDPEVNQMMRAVNRYHYAAQQDLNPIVGFLHNSYSVAIMDQLRDLATDEEIDAATGGSIRDLRVEILAIQDGLQEQAEEREMNGTLYTASPFKPGGYTNSVIPMGQRQLGQLQLGQTRLGQLDEWLDMDFSDLDELLGDFDGLLASLPLGALKDDYAERRDKCMSKSNVISKYTCLYELSKDVKDAIKDGDSGTAPPPDHTITKKEPKSEFPWVPVGIAGGIGLAALLYLVLKKKPA